MIKTCKICENSLIFFTQGIFFFRETKMIVPIYYCRKCNSFERIIDKDILIDYLEKSVYTDLCFERESYHQRIEFYDFIFQLINKHKIRIENWLDFGCSYGHFIDFLNKKNISSYGIEISDQILKYANTKGLNIYNDFQSLPKDLLFWGVSLIDSLYYSEDPKLLMKQINELLYDNGLLVIRVTNRNWLVKFDKYFRNKGITSALMDHIIGYSKKSIKYLLKDTGFAILEITSFEKGKHLSRRNKFFYTIATISYFASFGIINFLPGIIIVARKIRPLEN